MQRAVERYLQHLAVERGLAANTLSAYRRDLARYVRFVTEIDRTGVGKVNKRKLRADYADALTSGR